VDIAQRMASCSARLSVQLGLPEGGPAVASLQGARLCGCRLCPFCEWRRTRAWRGRVIRGLTALLEERPKYRAVFLTLTVRNCAVGDLQQTVTDLHAGWKRLTKLAEFPTDLWLRRTEVTFSGGSLGPPEERGLFTRSKGAQVPGSGERRKRKRPEDLSEENYLLPFSCHPHLHALLIVPPSYFGKNYIRHNRWRELWMMSARLDYPPIVDVRNVYRTGDDGVGSSPAVGAVCEAAKYATKGAEVMYLGPHLSEVHHQLRSLRLIGVSRALAPYVPSTEPVGDELMDAPTEAIPEGLVAQVAAVWDENALAYRPEC
jgi:hypothetical protein